MCLPCPAYSRPDSEQDVGRVIRNPQGKEHYTLLYCIGSGSYGAVFVAADNARSCFYAIKQIRLQGFTNPLSALSEGKETSPRKREAQAGTNTEVCALRHLNIRPHSSIPMFYHAFNADDSLYIVMEFSSGSALTNLLARYRSLNSGVFPTIPYYYLKFLVRCLLRAIHHCHRSGVAHLDIKPDNIHVEGPARLILVDFGQSYTIHEGVSDDPWLDSRIGAMAFLPPEILTSSTLYTSSYLNLKNLVPAFSLDPSLSPTCQGSAQIQLSSKTPHRTPTVADVKEQTVPHQGSPSAKNRDGEVLNRPGDSSLSTSSDSKKSKSTSTRSSSLSISYTPMHHVSTLFLKDSALYYSKSRFQITGTRFRLWMDALLRMRKFAEVDRSRTPPLRVSFENGSVKLNAVDLRDIMEISEALNDSAAKYSANSPEPAFMDSSATTFPSASDLLEIGIKLGILDLKGTTLHIFNSKLAIDSWAIGLVFLICLIGDYPFRDVSAFETVPSVQLMAEAIRQQLDSTLETISQGNFERYKLYLKTLNDRASCDFCGKCSLCLMEKNFCNQQLRKNIAKFCHKPVLLPESFVVSSHGPLSPDLHVDLFLLIAGLLHPNPKARMSISEAMECPWLANINEFTLQQHENYSSASNTAIFSSDTRLQELAMTTDTRTGSLSSTVDNFVKSVKEFHKSSNSATDPEHSRPPAVQATNIIRAGSRKSHLSGAEQVRDHSCSGIISRKYSAASGIPEVNAKTARVSISAGSVMSSMVTDDNDTAEKPFDFEAYKQGRLNFDTDAHKLIFDESCDTSDGDSSSL
ncbi:Kinase [Giardia duodenalis ATCC 50581]|uniref:Kinase n=2 Tax=Giardia intestinalis TaxID=5741 RepID=C6LYA8_GIAIB|nr:Kinase [Giardia intestinalis ATCC 50581]